MNKENKEQAPIDIVSVSEMLESIESRRFGGPPVSSWDSIKAVNLNRLYSTDFKEDEPLWLNDHLEDKVAGEITFPDYKTMACVFKQEVVESDKIRAGRDMFLKSSMVKDLQKEMRIARTMYKLKQLLKPESYEDLKQYV